MSWLSDKLKEIVPYAMVALPFTPWGAALKGMRPEWMQGIMKSKFMNSILGAGLKDAGLKYALATAQGKRNPEIIAKDALLRGMFTNAYKVGFDPNMMMGETPIPAFADKVIEASPATIGTRMGPGYEEYGQSMMDKYYAPGRGGVDLEALTGAKEGILEYPTTIGDYYKDWTPQTVDEANKITGGWKGIDLPERGNLINWMEEPAQEALTISGEDIQGPVTEAMMAEAKHPLAGLGYMTTTKTEPSRFERLLGKVKEAEAADITRGSDEWNEMFDIGATRPDMSWAMGTAYDWFRDPLTEAQIERDEQEEYEKKMARLMWPRRMEDVYDFEGRFGVNRGGLASLANGGRIGYQDGGPTGMSLEELKRQIFSNYKMETAMDPEGAGSMTPIAPMDFEDDFRFDEGTIGPNPTFEDEFGGYLDLAGGPGTKEPWEIRAEIEAMQSYLLLEEDPAKREILEIRLDELIGQLGTTPSAARGGRMGYAGGGMTDEEKITYQGLLDSGYTRDEAIKIIELHGTDYSGLQVPSFLKSQAGIDEKAQGGRVGMYGGGDLNAIPGGMVSGPGSETSDSVPAQLSNNEFVVTADAVRAAGGGDIDLGAQKFYGIMNALDPNSAKLGEPPVYS